MAAKVAPRKILYKVRTLHKSPRLTKYVGFAHVEGNPQHVIWAGKEHLKREDAIAEAQASKKKIGTVWPRA